jgi:hypothetical protein
MNEVHLTINPLSSMFQNQVHLTAISPYVYSDILYDTTEHWNARRNIIAKKGTIYIYSDHEKSNDQLVPGIKVGDGTSYLIDMPFIDNGLRDLLLHHINDSNVHVSETDRKKWGTTQYSVDGTLLKFL